MLTGLRHDRLVGGDHQEGEVDTAYASEHVADETLVAGDVDDAGLLAAGQGEPCEAEVYGEAALLLLDKAVRVDTGHGLNEGRLTMVDVAGCGDYVHVGATSCYEPRIAQTPSRRYGGPVSGATRTG